MDPIHHMTQPGPERKRGWRHYLGVEGEPSLLFRIKFKGKKKNPHEIISAALTKTWGARSRS